MIQDLNGLRRKISEFDSTIRKAGHFRRELEHSRAELRHLWDDSCSHEMANRFFNPHAEDAAITVAELEMEHQNLKEARAALASFQQSHALAWAASQEFQARESECNSLNRAIGMIVAEVSKHIASAGDHVATAHDLMAQANLAAG